MMTIIRLAICVLALALAAGPSAAHSAPPKPNKHTPPWQQYILGKANGSAATPTGTDVADFTFPTTPPTQPGLDMLTTTTVSTLLGNLTGRTLTATFSLPPLTGSPIFTYYGDGQSWNPCSPAVASVHLFFSTDASTYSPGFASQTTNQTNYWWSNPVNYQLVAGTTSVTISDSLADPSQWSDANGQNGADPTATPGFYAAVSTVAQIGLSFGGGCFFDVGVATAGGTAGFSLAQYQAA